MLLSAFFRARSWTRGLPWLFLYFTLSMALLRLGRAFFGVGAVMSKSGLVLLILPGLLLFAAAVWGLGCLNEEEKQKLKGLLRP